MIAKNVGAVIVICNARPLSPEASCGRLCGSFVSRYFEKLCQNRFSGGLYLAFELNGVGLLSHERGDHRV